MTTTMLEKARDGYVFALARDPSNRPAMLNLAVLDLHDEAVTPLRRERAREALEWLRDNPEPLRPRHWWWWPVQGLANAVVGISGPAADPMWWRACYNLAADDTHTALRPSSAPADRSARSVGDLWNIAVTGAGVARWPRWALPPTARFTLHVTPGSLLLLAGAIVAMADPAGARLDAACAVLRAARTEVSPGDVRSRLFGAVPSKSNQPELAGLLVSVAITWPLPLDARTRYNLACLYASVAHLLSGEDRAALVERAERELLQALPMLDLDMLSWAVRDPSLRLGDLSAAIQVEVKEEFRRRRARQKASTAKKTPPRRAPETPSRPPDG